MYFKSALPEFYEEVRSLLIRMEREDLAGQLRELEIIQRCPCTDFGCASFNVSGSSLPDGFEFGPRRSTFNTAVKLNADNGKITIRTDQLGRIKALEVLNRPDVRRQLFKRR